MGIYAVIRIAKNGNRILCGNPLNYGKFALFSDANKASELLDYFIKEFPEYTYKVVSDENY